jgi:DNA-binding transcriptional LysR family regulator
LIDRSSYPTTLTPAGKVLYGQALALLQAFQNIRGHMHDAQNEAPDQELAQAQTQAQAQAQAQQLEKNASL